LAEKTPTTKFPENQALEYQRSSNIYFSFQRIVTFITGLLFASLGALIWIKTDSTGIIIVGALLSTFGVYIIIASLVPYKKTTQEISDEILGRVLIEMPLRIVMRSIGSIFDGV